MKNKSKNIFYLIGAVVLIVFISFFLYAANNFTNNNNATSQNSANTNSCPLDKRECESGFSVGRSGPDCEFEQCPEVKRCTPENRGVRCMDVEATVCGYKSDGTKQDYRNNCYACLDPTVDYYAMMPCGK